MTRVLYLKFFTLLQVALSIRIYQDSPSYSEALEKIENYSPSSSNLTYIYSLLESSAEDGNPDALLKLGEFWLFGFPLSDSTSDQNEFSNNGLFDRNFDLAMYYIKKSYPYSPDSGFYISLILHQSLLIPSFDKYVPLSSSFAQTVSSLKENSIQKLSSMEITSSIFHHQRCKSITPAPEFLIKNGTFSYYSLVSQFFPRCEYSCSQLGYLALIPAKKALEFIVRNRRVATSMKNVEELRYFDKDELRNSVKFHEKYMEDDPKIMSAIGKHYVAGDRGLGIEPNMETGINLLEKAAAVGALEAHEQLGLMYLNGLGVEKNYTKAIQHLEIAKNLGSLLAYSALGEMYMNGKVSSRTKLKA